MVRQSCAIGACDEKTYKHSDGVKFYYLRNVDDDTKKAWKRKIAETRKDRKILEIGDHVAICSRHFVDGDKRNMPTIIPRVVNGTTMWPNQAANRRIISKKRLDFGQGLRTSTVPTTDIDSNMAEMVPRSPPVSQKLKRIRESTAKRPAKELKELAARKEKEVKDLPTDIHIIYTEMGQTDVSFSPPLSKKLQILKQKVENEPDGVTEAGAAVRTNIRESLIVQLKRQLDEEKAKTQQLQHDIMLAKQSNSFGIDRFKGNPVDFNFYTGLPDYLTFLSLCDFLQPEKHRICSLYYNYKTIDPTYVNIRGREPTLGVQDQLFLVLSRLRQGYKELDLAHRFNISTFTVSEIVSKWTKHMSHMLGQLPIWASRAVIDKNMPQAFKDLHFEQTRIIIDCTEIFIQQPSSNLVLQSVLFSTYKNHHTAKGLVGIAPHGPITFASDLYVGSASDFDITKDCGILKLLEPNDHIMADKGFEIQKLLDNLNVRVEHPPILRGVIQMSEQQETETRRIARLRIHVERAIERVKNFRILQESFPYSQWRLLNDIWKTCNKLTLFQPPLIEDS